MAIKFHVIGTQLNAYRAPGGATATLLFDAGGGISTPAIITDNTSGVFQSKLIQMTHASSIRAVMWRGGANMPANSGPITIRVRIQPRFTGAPAANTVLWAAEGFGIFNSNVCWLYLDTTSKLNFLIKDQYGKTYVNVTTSAAISPTLTSGTPVEFMAAWDGTTTAGHITMSMNGVQVGTGLTASNVAAAWDPNIMNYIISGASARFTIGNYDLNELVIYDTAENTTYAVNSDFVTDTAFDGSVSGGSYAFCS